jgi:hypothetical protein
MSPAFEVIFPDSLDWEEDHGYWGYVQDHGRAVGAWNVGGGGPMVIVDFDNISPEHFLIGGAAMPGAGLPVGPGELCYSLRFTVPEASIGDTVCVAPYFFPPAGTWTFTDSGGGYPPWFCGQDVGSETDPEAEPACFPIIYCGDAEASGLVNITDCVYLLAYIFGGGPAPLPYIAGDVDCSGFVNVSDVVYIRAYIFSGGPEPCAECP